MEKNKIIRNLKFNHKMIYVKNVKKYNLINNNIKKIS